MMARGLAPGGDGMPHSSTNWPQSYGITAAGVALAAAARIAFDPLLGDRFPFLTFFVAIVVAAWYGGVGPGVLAVGLSWLTIIRVFLEPGGAVPVFGVQWRLLLAFILVGLAAALLGELLRAAQRTARASETEARRLLQEQRADRERLSTTLASIADAVITTNTEGRVSSLNPAAERLTGWGAAEAIGQPLGAVFRLVEHAADETADITLAALVQGSEALLPVDRKVLVARDEAARWIEHNDAPIKDEQGTVSGIVIVFRDITERRRAEAARRESERRFARFMQHLPGLAWIKDAEGRYIYANDEAERVFGTPRPELYGKTDEEVFPPETAAQFREHDRRALAGGAGVRVIETLVHKDGVLHYSLVSKFPILGPDGQAAMVGGMAIDITDRMQMETALRQQAERLQLALDSGRLGTWEWDVRTNNVTWSDNLEEIHGLPRGGFDGTFAGFQRLVHLEDRERVQRAIHDSFEQGSVYEVEFRTVWPDGSIHWISGRGMAIKDEGGHPIRMTGTAMDVTERKQIETSLREADRRKEEFLAVLSHELRNPLAPIQTSLYLMGQAGLTGAELERERAVVERQVQHLTRLVNDLLDVSRISRGRIELETKVVVLSEAIAEVADATRSQIDERRQELLVTLPERPIRLEADPTRLEQILLNLLTNASKYTDFGGRIGLSAERDGDVVVVRVRDTGIGISPEMLPRIFEMFVQGERRLDQARGGLGIGLSLVKNLVEKHGGSITAQSEGPGMGSEFAVRLPVLPEAPAAAFDAPLPARGDVPGVVARRRILVVDDNTIAADSLGRMLDLVLGQDVRVVYDGASALDLVETFRPEIVLLDLGMAAMDGYEVAMRLRERPECAGTRIIAVTGWGQEEDRRRTRQMGFELHLAKPVDAEALKELLTDPASDGSGKGLRPAVSRAPTGPS
jgi:PAS domain S-box-containing protein